MFQVGGERPDPPEKWHTAMERSIATRHDIPLRMALLEIKGVSKQFFADGKEMVALQDINLEIEDNEFVCFIGPSGCGKTTLLRIVAGLEEATEGTSYS